MRLSGRTVLAEHGGASSTGACRDVNEDALGVIDAAEVFAVADASGGADPLRRASTATIASLRRSLSVPEPSRPDDRLAAALTVANRELHEALVRDIHAVGAGCTVSALHLQPSRDTLTHVGDCRIYRWLAAERRLEVLTLDHRLWAEMLRAGESVERALALRETHPNVLTRALGALPDVEVDVQHVAPIAGSLYLLCTDGLTDALSHEEIRALLLDADAPLDERCARLGEASDRKGGYDNATALLVRRRGAGAAP